MILVCLVGPQAQEFLPNEAPPSDQVVDLLEAPHTLIHAMACPDDLKGETGLTIPSSAVPAPDEDYAIGKGNTNDR